MLITFKTRASCPDITMFGDVGLSLIALMGRRKTLPGVIDPEDIPEAMRSLRHTRRNRPALPRCARAGCISQRGRCGKAQLPPRKIMSRKMLIPRTSSRSVFTIGPYR